MPAGTTLRVRSRQAVTATTVALVSAASIVVIAITYGLLSRPHVDPMRIDPTADGYTSPLERVPPRWPVVDIHDPRDAIVPRSVRSATVEHPHVLEWGTVEGVAFQLVGWNDARNGPCLAFVPLDGLGGDDGLARTCASATPGAVPSERDLRTAVSIVDPERHVYPALGFVSERVQTVWAWGGLRQGMFEVPILDAPARWEVRPFIVFPPTDHSTIEVEGQAHQLARGEACAPSGDRLSCQAVVEQSVPIGTDPSARIDLGPGEWPEVTFGGDFTPYIDHVVDSAGRLDPGVVGEKVVIAYGTVEGVPWSLTAFNVVNAGGWKGSAGPDGEPGPAGELAIGSPGGGSGSALYGSTPWRPQHLSGGVLSWDTVAALHGVVSPRVASLRLELDGYAPRTLELIAGPPAVEASFYLLFMPQGLTGRIVALDADGSELEQMCLRDMMAVPPGGDPCL
jgi:hypothetical protein